MHSWNNTCCIKHGVKHKVHQVQRKKLIVTMYVQIVCLWLKHKLASALAIGQLYHQSATAPRCTTQLRDVRGLPLPVRRSRNFLTIFYSSLFPVLIRKFPNQSPSTVLVDSHKFQIKIVSSSVSVWNILPFIYFTQQWRHFTSWIKK